MNPSTATRWEVFKQDTPQKPHQAVGSVHAGDPEHALLTARHVFVRRPSAVSLWVVPEGVILSRTVEELSAVSPLPSAQTAEPDARAHTTPHPTTDTPQPFFIFRKTSSKRSMTFVDFVGELEAPSAEDALQQALERYTDAQALAWWVVPASSVTRSEPDEDTRSSWFEPAKDKTYKQQSSYGVVGSHVSKHKVRGVADEH